jgi:hypothetical protein
MKAWRISDCEGHGTGIQIRARIEQVGKGVSGELKPFTKQTLSAPPQIQSDYLDRLGNLRGCAQVF